MEAKWTQRRHRDGCHASSKTATAAYFHVAFKPGPTVKGSSAFIRTQRRQIFQKSSGKWNGPQMWVTWRRAEDCGLGKTVKWTQVFWQCCNNNTIVLLCCIALFFPACCMNSLSRPGSAVTGCWSRHQPLESLQTSMQQQRQSLILSHSSNFPYKLYLQWNVCNIWI